MAIVARRYAEALINVALDKNMVETYENQLLLLSYIVSTKEIKEIINYPGISRAKKKELLHKIIVEHKDDENGIIKVIMKVADFFKGKEHIEIDKEIINFYMLLIDHGRHNLIEEIVANYKELADRHKGILNIAITSSVELEKEQIEKIKEKIGAKYKNKNVAVKTIIDSKVLGGVKVKIGDTVIDGTLKATLENMGKQILQ